MSKKNAFAARVKKNISEKSLFLKLLGFLFFVAVSFVSYHFFFAKEVSPGLNLKSDAGVVSPGNIEKPGLESEASQKMVDSIVDFEEKSANEKLASGESYFPSIVPSKQVEQKSEEEEDPFEEEYVEQAIADPVAPPIILETEETSRVEVVEESIGYMYDAEDSQRKTSTGLSPDSLALLEQMIVEQSRDSANLFKPVKLSITRFERQPDNDSVPDNKPVSDAVVRNPSNSKPVAEFSILNKLGLLPGDKLLGQTIIAVNSDVSNHVAIELVSPEVQGWRMIGSIERRGEYLVASMNTLIDTNNVKHAINTILIDPESTLPGVRTDYDSHWLSRWGSLAGASFLSAFGKDAANRPVKLVKDSDGNVYQEEAESTFEDRIMMTGGVMMERASNVVAENFNRPPTVTLKKFEKVGVLILGEGR